MTDHDQDAAIGGLTKRYSDAKRTRTALIAAIENHRSALTTAERALHKVSAYGMTSATVPRGVEYVDAVTINGHLDELRSTCEELERTQALLKDAGVDVS